MPKIDDKLAKNTSPPESGQTIIWDSETPGFGLRITAGGARTFVFRYRQNGLRRKMRIGPYGTDKWTVAAARKRAGELRREVDRGNDPLAAREERRKAPSVAELCERFMEDHVSRRRPKTVEEYRSMIDRYVLPSLGRRKVAEVTYQDVDALHRKITKAGHPYRANRVVAVLSKMFNLALTKWHMRPKSEGNPAQGIERNYEEKRERYLSADEVSRLVTALAEHRDQQAANIIRLLLLTGARSNEVKSARWEQFNLEAGTWTLPSHHTKEKKIRHVPLSAPARQLLADLSAKASGDYVFPGRGTAHRVDIKKDWAAVCRMASIEGARIHDLRHSFASILVGGGLSLPIIGRLLGHTQQATTHRYAHLAIEPLQEATERVGAVVAGDKGNAKIVPLR